MAFAAVVLAFAERFLSGRTFDLIVSPALADFEYDRNRSRHGRVDLRAYAAVLIALGGGVRSDVAGQLGIFVFLTLVPACYYVALLTICGDFFRATSGLLAVGGAISIFSVAPVMMCFWPDGNGPPSKR